LITAQKLVRDTRASLEPAASPNLRLKLRSRTPLTESGPWASPLEISTPVRQFVSGDWSNARRSSGAQGSCSSELPSVARSAPPRGALCNGGDRDLTRQATSPRTVGDQSPAHPGPSEDFVARARFRQRWMPKVFHLAVSVQIQRHLTART